MSIRIIALGRKMPAWVTAGFEEYSQRIPREWPVELVELKAEKRDGGRSTTQMLAAEAQRIRAQWSPGFHKVVLDERGQLLTSAEFARSLSSARDEARRIAFVIGSADGLDAGIKAEADTLLALSRLTLPHGLVRVMLAEQLYRAVSSLQGHPYHRP
jgi:23S rRNA (pseudouridine1915-N3)-methyltransferase